MSAAERAGGESAPEPTSETQPPAPPRFTPLGTAGVGVCEGDVCAMPTGFEVPTDGQAAAD